MKSPKLCPEIVSSKRDWYFGVVSVVERSAAFFGSHVEIFKPLCEDSISELLDVTRKSCNPASHTRSLSRA